MNVMQYGPPSLHKSLGSRPKDLPHLWQHSLGSSRFRQGRRAAVFCALDSGEADVVLLDDGRVQGVEVKQQHVLLV